MAGRLRTAGSCSQQRHLSHSNSSTIQKKNSNRDLMKVTDGTSGSFGGRTIGLTGELSINDITYDTGCRSPNTSCRNTAHRIARALALVGQWRRHTNAVIHPAPSQSTRRAATHAVTLCLTTQARAELKRKRNFGESKSFKR